MALDPDILHLILSNLDNEWFNNDTSQQRKRLISMVGCYLVVSFACSLRGNEGFMMDLHGLISHIKDGKNDAHQACDHPMGKSKHGQNWPIATLQGMWATDVEINGK